MRTKRIRVSYLTRVEGEGALTILLRGREVVDVRLEIFEPPRFFEGILRGRRFDEAPDITARICGICPVAYQMSACRAMEQLCGAALPDSLWRLRRILYCGEWIESHALHIFLLHAPDFLGYESVVDMARHHRSEVERGLQLKKVGNEVLRVIGGREVHPVNVRVGGFYRLPSRDELASLREPLLWAREAAWETVRWVAGFEFPDFEANYEFVALRHPTDYPLAEGHVVTSGGLEIPVDAFDQYFEEEQVPYSNALHCTLRGRGPYMVGPLARFSLNFDRLSPLAREAAAAVRLHPPCYNPFRSIVVRAVEVLWACDEALRLLEGDEGASESCVPVSPRAGVGYGATEAPRGLLYHRYRVNAQGLIEEAKIVPPTSQNQRRIELDLREFLPSRLDLAPDVLRWQCEQAVRNYDPCISCATHFLDLRVVHQ
mgnify:CR=1 FL=1